MKTNILIIALLIPLFVLSQTSKKETVYLLFEVDSKEKCKIQVEQTYKNKKGVDFVNKYKKKHIKNRIIFNICDEEFIYTEGVSKIDTCSISFLKRIKMVDLDYIVSIYNTNEDFKHHVFEKIYFIEKIPENKIVKHEVYWSGEWSTKD